MIQVLNLVPQSQGLNNTLLRELCAINSLCRIIHTAQITALVHEWAITEKCILFSATHLTHKEQFSPEIVYRVSYTSLKFLKWKKKTRSLSLFFCLLFLCLQLFLPSLEETQTISWFMKQDVGLLKLYLTKPLMSPDSMLITHGKGKT